MGERRKYPPGVEADFEISRAAHDAKLDKSRERLRKDYDADTVRRAAEIREERGDAAADDYQKRREAFREEDVEDTIQGWARREMEADFRVREKDMERYKIENGTKVLKGIDRLRDEIYKALDYRPEHRGESVIDKDWGNAMLNVLNELSEQVRFEKSFPRRMFDVLRAAMEGRWDARYTAFTKPLGADEAKVRELRYIADREGEQKKYTQPKWKNGLRALEEILLESRGEFYAETPDNERKRMVERDEAIAEYQQGEVRKEIAEM